MTEEPTFSKLTESGPFRALAYLILLIGAVLSFNETADDPFITFRYAANLVAGHGPVFNIGERVEGYSSPMHLLECVILLKALPSVGMLFKAKLASVAFAMIALYEVGVLAHLAGLSRKEQLFAQILTAINANFAIAAVDGLETTLYTTLLTAAVICFARENERKNGWTSAIVVFLAMLCRPEALAVFAFMALWRAWSALRGQFPRRSAFQWVGAFSALAVIFFTWRFSYYGNFLPNTYYAKLRPLRECLPLGAEDLMQCLSPLHFGIHVFRAHRWSFTQIFQPFIAPLFWSLAVAGFLSRGKAGVKAGIAAAIAAGCLAVLRSGGDWMPGWRFIAPTLGGLAVLQVIGLRQLALWLESKSAKLNSRYPVLATAVLLIWAMSAAIAPWNSWSRTRFSTSDDDLLRHSTAASGELWITLADYCRTRLPPGAIVAYSEAGLGPWRNLDKTFIDFRGLTDREIAHSAATNRISTGVVDRKWFVPGDPLYEIFRKRRPDAIIDIDNSAGDRDIVLGEYNLRETITIPIQYDAPHPVRVYLRQPVAPGN